MQVKSVATRAGLSFFLWDPEYREQPWSRMGSKQAEKTSEHSKPRVRDQYAGKQTAAVQWAWRSGKGRQLTFGIHWD